jgi:hypothetical protein
MSEPIHTGLVRGVSYRTLLIMIIVPYVKVIHIGEFIARQFIAGRISTNIVTHIISTRLSEKYGESLHWRPSGWICMPALFQHWPNVVADLWVGLMYWPSSCRDIVNNSKVILYVNKRQPPGEYLNQECALGWASDCRPTRTSRTVIPKAQTSDAAVTCGMLSPPDASNSYAIHR